MGWQMRKRISNKPQIIRVGMNRKFLAVTDSAFSSLVIYKRLPDWNESHFLLRFLRSSDNFLDIGANVDFYSVLASTIIKGGEIIAIEANPRNADIIRQQIELNHLKSARVLEVALSNFVG